MDAKIKNLPGGRVELSFANGDRYVGEMKNNTITGKGTMYYLDGRTYEGEFLNDTWDGFGKATFADGTVYEGGWKNNLRTGHGKETFLDQDHNVIVVYEGEYAEDRLEGPGVITWADGTTLEAEFSGQENVKKCRMSYSDKYYVENLKGCVYEGEMSSFDNRYERHGQGKLTTKYGMVYEGRFDRNKKEGPFRITYRDGSYEVAEYKDDIQVKVVFPRAKAAEKVDTDRYLSVGERGNDIYSEELRPYFEDIIGMHNVKAQLDRMYKRFRIDAMRQAALGIEESRQGYYFLITGNPGTGKSTVARIIGKMLHEMGILPSDKFVEVDRSRLVGEYIGQTAIKTSEVISSARGGTLFVDEAYMLYKKDNERDFGAEAMDTLLKDMEDHRGEYCVILAGYKSRMDDMIRNANPGLASRFDHRINIEDYTPDELVDILVSMADKKSLKIRKEARQVILSRIEREKLDETFDNARYSRRLLDEAIERQALRLSDRLDKIDLEELRILDPDDFGTPEKDLSTLESCLETLSELVGLKDVKEEVGSIVRAIKIQNESRKRGLAIASNPIPLDFVFTGNAGTGKTTVARLLSKIYYHLGVLKRPDVFVECVRADLVGRHQGETAIRVKEVVRKALGGILFIDEAYSLMTGPGDDFGAEAVSTLVSEIENHRDDLAVIMAGYTEEMEAFLEMNPGLKSRMPKVIEFPDYSDEELAQIFVMDLEKRGYEVAVDRGMLRNIIKAKMMPGDFGNARGVRNLCDEALENHNERINKLDLEGISNETILTVTDEDIREL